MNFSTVIFWAIALMTVGSALFVALSRNILHAAFSLCLSFLGVAALYVFLQADFVAAVQLIVYVGGILVLIMFAVMFSAHVYGDALEARRKPLALIAGTLAAVGLLCVICLMAHRLSVPLADSNQHIAPHYVSTVTVEQAACLSGTVDGQAACPTSIGHLLLTRYLLPFEVVSIVLLGALIGAVVIVRQDTWTAGSPPATDGEAGAFVKQEAT